MDWFEKLTGFPEASYEETRARLEVVNGCVYRKPHPVEKESESRKLVG